MEMLTGALVAFIVTAALTVLGTRLALIQDK